MLDFVSPDSGGKYHWRVFPMMLECQLSKSF